MVERFLAAATGTTGVASVELLQSLASSLSDVIGEDGFESLLMRSLRRVGEQYRWLRLDPRERPGDPEFEQLRQVCQGRDEDDVRAASTLLFATFVDTLSVLIGVHLTTHIITSALAAARAGLEKQGTAP